MSVAVALVALSLAIPDLPYVRSRADTSTANDPNAHCLWWPGPGVTFQQATKGNPPTQPAGSEFEAVTRSFASWQAVMDGCGGLTISEGPRQTDTHIGHDPASNDNHNTIVFRQTFCTDLTLSTNPCWTDQTCMNVYDCWEWGKNVIALTTTTYDRAGGRIYDADVEFNAAPDKVTGARFNFTTVDGPVCPKGGPYTNCAATDVQNTMTHEAGHVLGLDHTARAGSTMNPSAPTGEISKRIIDDGSKSFVCEVYPKGAAPRDCVINPVSSTLGTALPGCGAAGGPPALLALVALVRAFRVRRKARR
jgi:hypothetical protein